MSATSPHLYEVAIGMIPGVGAQLTRMLISYCGSAEGVFKEKKGRLLKVPGVGASTADAILKQNVFEAAEKEIALAAKYHTKILFYTSKEFPERLKNIPDAPSLLYCRGTANLNSQKNLSNCRNEECHRIWKRFRSTIGKGNFST